MSGVGVTRMHLYGVAGACDRQGGRASVCGSQNVQKWGAPRLGDRMNLLTGCGVDGGSGKQACVERASFPARGVTVGRMRHAVRATWWVGGHERWVERQDRDGDRHPGSTACDLRKSSGLCLNVWRATYCLEKRGTNRMTKDILDKVA